MEVRDFTDRLEDLSGADILGVARAIRAELDTADGEISWWRATVTVGCTLRRCGRTRQAGLAAHEASAAVVRAATREGLLPVDRDAVTTVARAASDVARGLAAGAPVTVSVGPLLAPWRHLPALVV